MAGVLAAKQNNKAQNYIFEMMEEISERTWVPKGFPRASKAVLDSPALQLFGPRAVVIYLGVVPYYLMPDKTLISTES